jgi:hypothetical protein
MKKLGLFITLFITSNLFSQTLLLEENFDLSVGDLTTVSPNWTESPTGSVDIEVISGNLTYTDYPSSGIGNKIVLNGGASRSGVIHSFATQSTIGSTVYFSLLLNVTSTIDMDLNTSNGDYFYNFQNSGLSILRGYIYVRQGVNSAKYSIGLAKSSPSSLTWYTTELDVGSTYLVVVAYSFISGSDNDAVKLWINPDLSGTEPIADISLTSGTDAVDLGYIQFRQRALSGDMDVDGLRVADAWSQAPLPVELSSFSASIINEGVRLNWVTETEVSNYGFEILRSTQNDIWDVMGFVEGHGNSNSPKNYSFIDNNITGGTYSYRIKQIDNDGKFEYSKVIEIDVGTPIEYELSQNYPNPFNPSTTIRFSIPEKGNVKLIVYNILGETVATLVNEVKEVGIHAINFSAIGGSAFGGNAYALPSGIYFYKLETGSFLQVKKMSLVR